ncbi:MAG: hypothetical protein E7335_12115 [Clostridiales bacterium]|nr:hypothetical protein [Clostridiales bacterium]
MTELVLPDSLTFIAEDAFEGCGEFALTVPENCYAYDRCVELGLIKSNEPDPSVIESAHPYPDEFDYTWAYDAGEGTESVTITFFADTETEEDYDFIYLYTLDDEEIGKYSSTELAGQSVTIDGTGFKLRLTSDEAWDGGNAYYGFKLDSIVPKKAVPLTFESITTESSAVNAGETIRWTVATTGGKAPVYYDYTVLLGEEKVATGTVEAPNAIEYKPVRAGEYKLSVIARDSADVVLPAQLSAAVTVVPSTAYPESAHPYAANTDQSWVYAAEENVESLTVIFSEETKTESGYDYIWFYDQMGTQIGKYAGTELAGQSIEIIGNAFTIRLTSDGSNEYHGFTITNIEKYTPGPLGFVSLTVDKSKAKTGDLITWTMETEGGRRPVTYEYTVTLNGETKYTGSVTRPEQITYVPMTAGDYTMSAVAKDAVGNELPAQTSKVRITERGETAAEYFTVEQTSGNFGRITAYTGTDTAVVIPSLIGEYTIESIGSNVFKNNTSIISVSMPASLKSIGSGAFYGCTNLHGISLNSGLETIYPEAFRGCTSLTELYIPDSVTTLSYRAFYGCSKLAKMNYPVGWTTTYDSATNTYGSYGGIFAGTALKTMHIPSGVTIPTHAFMDCPNFTSITIGDENGYPGWKGSSHFKNCTGLTSIEMPNWDNISSSMFAGCTSLTSITFKSGTRNIYSSAFSGCTRLASVELNEGLETIYPEAFKGCTSLTELYIPDSVTTLSYRAFYGCSKLAEMNYPVGWTTTYDSARNGYGSYGGIFDGTALKTISIPEGIVELPKQAFRSCTNFTHFELPDSLQSIPAYAFAGCTGLEKIWIPEGIEPQYDEEGNQTSFVPIASTAFNDVSTGTLTIHGVSGSYAETFADSKGYPFVAEAFEYTPATLSGTVTDAAGNPLSGVTVTVYKGPTTNYPFGSTTTNSSGAWSMENVKVGSYYGVGFEKEGYVFTPEYIAISSAAESELINSIGSFVESEEALNIIFPEANSVVEAAALTIRWSDVDDAFTTKWLCVI